MQLQDFTFVRKESFWKIDCFEFVLLLKVISGEQVEIYKFGLKSWFLHVPAPSLGCNILVVSRDEVIKNQLGQMVKFSEIVFTVEPH